jgi:hypothetical protein
MARVSDAHRALQLVQQQIDFLDRAVQYEDECRALSQLLQASCPILQHWQDNSIHDAKVKSAGE